MRCPDHRVELYAPLLIEHTHEFAITTPLRQAAFLATIGHESAALRYTAEVWGPTETQKRYEGRLDLGNTQPGDGFLFRGRGLIQLTGRGNYVWASAALGTDYVNNPHWLERSRDATRVSACWFARHGCNEWADKGDFLAVSRIVNRGTPFTEKLPINWQDRQAYYGRAGRALIPDWSSVIAGSKSTAPPP